MSTQQLQSILNHLIRFPEHHRGEGIERFLSGFDLTEQEKWQARSLSVSHYVAKFGKERRWKRYRTYIRHFFPVTVKSIGDNKAQQLFYTEFEPAHPALGLGEITPSFFRYFTAHEERLRALFGFPEFVGDLLRYEFAEHCLHFDRTDFARRGDRESRLAPSARFVIEDLKHDVIAFVEQARPLKEEELVGLHPESGDTTVLFARVPSPENPEDYSLSQFVIDSTLKGFLLGEAGAGPRATELPPCYDELVELGLCIPRSE